MRKTLIGAVLLTVAMTGTTAAAPNFIGPTGLIATPTAETLNQGGYSIGLHTADNVNSLSLNLGLVKDVEIGLTRFDNDFEDFNILNAKWKFLPEADGRPALAFGIQDAGNKIDNTPYLVASQNIGGGSRVHYGIGGGTIDGVFGGFEKDFNKGTLMAEYDGDNLNLGVRFDIASGVKVNVGLLDMDDFFVGISLTK